MLTDKPGQTVILPFLIRMIISLHLEAVFQKRSQQPAPERRIIQNAMNVCPHTICTGHTAIRLPVRKTTERLGIRIRKYGLSHVDFISFAYCI